MRNLLKEIKELKKELKAECGARKYLENLNGCWSEVLGQEHKRVLELNKDREELRKKNNNLSETLEKVKIDLSDVVWQIKTKKGGVNMAACKEGNAEFTVSIERDDFDESPREWDNLGVITTTRGANVGDTIFHDYGLTDGAPVKFLEFIEEEYGECVWLPVYMFDHSGVTISTTPFSCPWDSGQIGYIWCPKSKILKASDLTPEKLFGEEKCAEGILRSEIEVYDQFIRGDIYEYRITKEHVCPECGVTKSEIVESCGGFYGIDSVKDAIRDSEYYGRICNPSTLGEY